MNSYVRYIGVALSSFCIGFVLSERQGFDKNTEGSNAISFQNTNINNSLPARLFIENAEESKFDLLHSLNKKDNKPNTLDSLLGSMLDTKGIAWDSVISDGKENLFYALYEQFAMENPALAANMLNDIKDADQREFAIRELSMWWGDEDPNAAFDWLNTLSGAEYGQAFVGVFGRFAEQNTTVAAEYIKSIDSPELKLEGIRSLATIWARQDIGAVMDWADSMDNLRDKNHAYTTAMYSYIEVDPLSASLDLMNLPEGDIKANLVQKLGYQLADRNPNEAFDWATQTHDPKLKARALDGIAQAFSVNYADGTFDSIFDGASRREQEDLITVMSSMYNRTPDVAAAALFDLPENKLEFLSSKVIESWYGQDREAATEWATSLPQGTSRDIIVGQAFKLESKAGPSSESLKWLAMVDDDAIRGKLINEYVNVICDGDLTKAYAMVNLSPVSSEQKNDLTDHIENHVRGIF